MKRLFAASAGLCSLFAATLLAGSATGELDALKTGYAAEKAQLEAACEPQKAHAWAAYRQSVDALLQTFREKGDFDSVLACQAEQKRCAVEGTVNTNSVVVALAGAVAQYQKALLDAASACDQARIKLQRLYIDHLTALMQSETRADRLTEATAVRDELQAAKTGLVFQEADAASEAPKAQPSAPQPGPSPADDLAMTMPGTWTITWRHAGRSGTEMVLLKADGKARSISNGTVGSWEIKERVCLIHWPTVVNALTVAADGTHMAGLGRQGAMLSAVKSTP